jgi:hypothetical protein
VTYLKEILAVCSTSIGLAMLFFEKDGTVITAVIGFWGVLLGHEVTKEALKQEE